MTDIQIDIIEDGLVVDTALGDLAQLLDLARDFERCKKIAWSDLCEAQQRYDHYTAKLSDAKTKINQIIEQTIYKNCKE